MAEYLHKDQSSIKKEIIKHRILTHVCDYLVPCANYAKCKIRKDFPFNCRRKCEEYREFYCKRRDRTPGACNGCENASHCHYDKYKYDAKIAQSEYEETLSESRKGQRMTTTEIAEIGAVMLPLLKKGLAPQQIYAANPGLKGSVRAFYRAMHTRTFRVLSGIELTDLRYVVSRRPNTNRKNDETPAQARKYTLEHTYSDFIVYVNEHVDVLISEMDTVYNNDPGPYIQTFLIRKYHLLIGILHDGRTASDMVKGVDMLQNMLGKDLFAKYFSINLTDRGPEFADVTRLEFDADGVRRTHEFYCDAQSPTQKSLMERMHEIMRDILPKHRTFHELGLYTQDDLNLVISNVDSYPSPKMHGKSPLELVYKDDPELFEALKAFGIRFIDFDELILTPQLLKNKK